MMLDLYYYPVFVLLTGVRHHPPGRTDKNLSADASVPRLAGFP